MNLTNWLCQVVEDNLEMHEKDIDYDYFEKQDYASAYERYEEALRHFEMPTADYIAEAIELMIQGGIFRDQTTHRFFEALYNSVDEKEVANRLKNAIEYLKEKTEDEGDWAEHFAPIFEKEERKEIRERMVVARAS